jgi:hypothetical protein
MSGVIFGCAMCYAAQAMMGKSNENESGELTRRIWTSLMKLTRILPPSSASGTRGVSFRATTLPHSRSDSAPAVASKWRLGSSIGCDPASVSSGPGRILHRVHIGTVESSRASQTLLNAPCPRGRTNDKDTVGEAIIAPACRAPGAGEGGGGGGSGGGDLLSDLGA